MQQIADRRGIFKAACGRSVDRISLEPGSKKSDPNAEWNGFAIFAFLNLLELSKKSETFRDGSDGYSGHLITYAWPSLNGAPSKRRKNEKSEGNLVTKISIMASRTIDFPLWNRGGLRALFHIDPDSRSTTHSSTVPNQLRDKLVILHSWIWNRNP